MGAKFWLKVVRLEDELRRSEILARNRYHETVEVIERAMKIETPILYTEKGAINNTASCLDAQKDIVIGGIIYSPSRDANGINVMTIRFQGSKPGFQGQGVGRLLLREVARIAKERGLSKLTCQPINEFSAEWYQSQGFNNSIKDAQGRLWLSMPIVQGKKESGPDYLIK